MLTYKLNARGGSPPPLWLPPRRYHPNRCHVIIAKRRGGMGGQAHVPSFIRTSILNHINVKGILQSPEFLFLYYEIKNTGMRMETGNQNPKTLPEEEYKRKYWILSEV